MTVTKKTKPPAIPVRNVTPLAAPTVKKASPLPVRTPAKKFKITDWDAADEGEKIIIYADTGMGKTTLASLAPDPVFLGLDEGGRKLRHPVTGELLRVIEGVETYQDVRDVLQQVDVFDNNETVVIDTVTILQDWAVPHMLTNITKEKGGRVTNIVGYGYNKGYQHLYDLMKFILQDCDRLIHQGKNVILIAQAAPNKVSHPGGEDYLRDGPRLYAGKPSTEALYCEWADYILRISYQNMWVEDKKVRGNMVRAIFTQQEVYFRAKARTDPPMEPVVSFEDPQDDSIWKFIFNRSE